jgi:hypothetical protein
MLFQVVSGGRGKTRRHQVGKEGELRALSLQGPNDRISHGVTVNVL